MSNSIPFGIDVFDNNKMKERLSASLYEKILHGQSEKVDFTDEELNEYAAALLVWARERGATRYSHWFSPLGNNTAGKRNSFESIDCDGLLTDKFRGKELKIGEATQAVSPTAAYAKRSRQRALHVGTTLPTHSSTKVAYTSPCTSTASAASRLTRNRPL